MVLIINPMSRDPLLQLLQQDARLAEADLAERSGLTLEEVKARIAAWEADGTILGYQAVVDREKITRDGVLAVIEVKLTPERGGGFDRLAGRIARFDQVTACHLMSGGYDLAVFVHGADLREVARFVSEKLSTLEGVLSTATHFVLKTYKEGGFFIGGGEPDQRLSVSP